MTTFDTFERLFTEAIEDGKLPRPKNYQAHLSLLNFQFNEWLKAERQAKLDTDTGELLNYGQLLTPGNFMAFMQDREAKQKQAKESRVKRWQMTTEPESWQELFTVSNWQDYMAILCETDPPLLIQEAGEYRPAHGVQAGCIAAGFRAFMDKKVLTITSREKLAPILCKLLPSFTVSSATVTNVSNTYKAKFQSQILTALKRI